jgi:GAF domain-containing protein
VQEEKPVDRQHSSDPAPDRSSPPQNDDARADPGQAESSATYAELAAIVLDRQPLGAVLRRIAELAAKSIPNVDEASVTLVERGRPRTVAFSGQLAVTLDERQYEDGYGPCLDAARHSQTLLVDTDSEDGVYSGFARQARRQGIRYVLSVGMLPLLQTGGGLNIYSTGAGGPLEESTITTATAFAGHAAVTLFNAAVYAGAQDEVTQMKQAMASRAQIEQAKGVIMSEHRCNAEEAFRLLVEMSSHSNRKLRDVAQSVITGVTSN